MSGIASVMDYIRDASGNGVNGATFLIKRLFDNSTVASGVTVADAVPLTSLAGSYQIDETTLGYPGPVIATVTDSVSGATRLHSSKPRGIVGAWRSIDVTRVWRQGGAGVLPGMDGELAVTTNGSNMIISVAAGECLAAIGDHGLLYTTPVGLTVTAGAADPTNPRIDTVILRFYPPGVAQEGRIDLILLPGTASATPSPPGLTTNLTTYWEYPLADVRVDATVTSLATSKVTDRRIFAWVYPSPMLAGDTLYVDANGKIARLPKGTSGQALVQGAVIPAWGSVASTSVTGLPTFPVGAIVGTSDTQTLTGKTLTTPTIQSFYNAAAQLITAPAGPDTIVGRATTDTLTNKTLTSPVITGGTVSGLATDLAVADGGTAASTAVAARTNLGLAIGSNVEAWSAALDSWATKAVPAGVPVGTTDAQTLTNKTLTSPAITTPTGVVKGDVGLGSVDNTSDATKNAATVTLTNKTLTAPTVADFTNADHTHGTVAQGGALAATSYPTMVGDTGAGGTKGAVPGPAAGDAAALKFLKADGTWTAVPSSGDASTNTSVSVDSEAAIFSGTTGKVLKRFAASGIVKAVSGVLTAVTAPAGALVGDTDTQTLANKTLTTPTVASLTNMQHDHSNSANGGTAVSAARNPVVYVPITYDGHSTGVNVTNTGNAVPSQLASTFTLLNGVVYDVMLTGAVEVGAPSSDYIYVGGQISSVYGTVIGEGTVGGERTLFISQGRTITGTGAALNCGINVKVGSGTGVFNSGSALLVAIPRT